MPRSWAVSWGGWGVALGRPRLDPLGSRTGMGVGGGLRARGAGGEREMGRMDGSGALITGAGRWSLDAKLLSNPGGEQEMHRDSCIGG